VNNITKEEMLEFANAVKDETIFAKWMETNHENLRAHIMHLVEQVGAAAVQMGMIKVLAQAQQLADEEGEETGDFGRNRLN